MKGKWRSLFVYGLAVIFLLCMTGMTAAEPAADQNKPTEQQAASVFKDVLAGDSNQVYINYLAKREIVSGFPDGRFHPQEGLTRAQAATLLVKAAGLSSKEKKAVFKDVNAGHWAASNIAAAAEAGILKGYPDGTYHPEEKLTRAQGISLVLRLSKQKDTGVELPQLKDLDSTHWAARSVAIGLAAGMVGLTGDKTQFLPDASFSRGDLSRALAVLLTTDPDLNQAPLNGSLEIKKGEAKVNDKAVTGSVSVKAGDLIVTSAGAEAQLNYPDGSSLLLKEKTTLTVKETRGRAYIKKDGTPGTSVDWLLVDLKKGNVFGALASNPNIKESGKTEKKTADPGEHILAGLSGSLEFLAAQDKELPWYKTAETSKVKVKVDMPWGVAAVRGSFWENTVTDTGCSTSLLEGTAELSAGGKTESLPPGKSSTVTQTNRVPTPPAPMTAVQVNVWVQQVTWLQMVAQTIQINQEIVKTEAVITVVVQQTVQINQQIPGVPVPQTPLAPVVPITPVTPPPAPVMPDILNLVNQALTQVQQAVGITNVVQLNVNQPGVLPVVPPPVPTQVTPPSPGPSDSETSSSTVTFVDPKLEAAVRQALNKPSGTITRSDMAKLQCFYASKQGIANLSGLQYAINLTELRLDFNRINDLSPLSNLGKLHILSLHHNNISDIAALANLAELSELYLGNNQIGDISNAKANWSGKPALIFLGLGWNRISDLSGLASAGNLQRLHLEYNNISDLGPLSSLVKLNILSLHHNPIENVTPLSGLTQLKEIYLTYCKISDISGVNWSGMTGLNVLFIGSNPLSDISPVAAATSLKDLRLINTPVSNISSLGSLSGLEVLDISATQVTDLSVLDSLGSLKGLSVNGNFGMNSTGNLAKIAARTGLLGLDISKTGINDLSILNNMSSLQRLFAAENNINNITSLQSKTGLVDLDLQGNPISSISGLSGLTNLEYLNIDNNKVQNISVLSGLTKLKNLHMGSNLITDLSVLNNHPGLITLSIFDNPVGGSISAIQNMSEMEELYMANTGASNLSSLLNKMTKLRVLRAGGNGIGNDQLPFLAGLKELQSLWLPYNQISDISTLASMTQLQDLNLESNNIQDITALGNVHNLQSLNVEKNRIQNISPVAGLANLVGLHLGGTQITDISALQPLTNGLRSLSLWDNQVGSSISVLGNMTHMQELYISNMGLTDLTSIVNNMPELNVLHAQGNQISDISALENKIHLQEIQLQHNNISNISALNGHQRLHSLNINNNQVNDISLVSGLTSLRNLHIGHNGIIDISALHNLNHLRTLSLYGNNVGASVYEIVYMADLQELYIDNMGLTDISQLLAGMNQLAILHASGNHISDIGVLSGKTSLKELDLDGNQITSISALSGLTNLRYLSFKENQVGNIFAIAGLSDLEGLDFGGNQVSTISDLDNLNKLRFLSMWDNPVINIDAAIGVIADMTAMEDLHIDNMGTGAKLCDLSALANMNKLKSLWASGNNISNISVLNDKLALQTLKLQYNQINDISALVTNCQAGGLGTGDEVDLRNNPLSSQATNIQTLQNAGVDVQY